MMSLRLIALTCISVLAVFITSSCERELHGAPEPFSASDTSYNNYRKPSGPWSIHVVRVPRSTSLFEIHAVHAGERAVGLSRLSDQTRALGSAHGTPVAAINGDFYQRDGPYAGDPR